MKKLENLKDGHPFAVIEGRKAKIFLKIGPYAGDYKVRQFYLSAERYGDGIEGQLGEEEIFKGNLKVIPVDFEPKSKKIQQWL
jgi:hypothetical protein